MRRLDGSPQIVTALIANDVKVAALPPLAVAPMVKSEKIKAIGVMGPHRSPALPDVPTLKEQGIDFPGRMEEGTAAAPAAYACLRSAQSLAARNQREHERLAQAVLP